jgi:hypothetical protein
MDQQKPKQCKKVMLKQLYTVCPLIKEKTELKMPVHTAFFHFHTQQDFG